MIDRAAAEFGGIDVLVSNAAFQMTHSDLGEISDEEWDYTFHATWGPTSTSSRLACRIWVLIVGDRQSSVNSDMPSPTLAPYAATKAANANLSASLASCWGREAFE